jgi:hypothetical protein
MSTQELGLSLAILPLLVLVSEATVLFHNTGVLSGWDSINQVLITLHQASNYMLGLA